MLSATIKRTAFSFARGGARALTKSANKAATAAMGSTTTNTRPTPSPSFNQQTEAEAIKEEIETSKRNHQQVTMDDLFIGMTGGEIFHEMMLRHGVDTVFGYAGGAILPVFDAIYNSKHFNFVLPRHEQGAGHMAEGYARAAGKPGVVLVTSGPGATNVITPMADALADGVPLVVFDGQD